jgi:hypothetical protein
VAVFEARDRVGGRVWSVPFGGAVVERGAEFILPNDQTVITIAARLGLNLVRKGTRYGNREPRGGRPVTRDQVVEGLARIGAEPPAAGGTLAGALAGYGLEPGVAEAIRARLEVSCAYSADDLEVGVLTESAAAFGDDAAKLFVALGAAAPPSEVLSVPERYWCYTQLGADGRPLPFVGAFAGSPGALEALGVAGGAEPWVESLRRLRPDLDLDLADGNALLCTWADDPWVRGAYSARSATSPLDAEALARPVGPLAFAGEHTAGEWHGLMEGALRSGARAAAEALAAGGR